MDEQPDDSQPVMPSTPPAPTHVVSKLAVVEVLDRDGHARLIVPVVRWPVTIGRAIDCDVVLDDAHAAARHASLSAALTASSAAGDAADAASAAGALTLQVGETVNGVQLPRRRLAAQQSAELAAGEVFQIGNTRLRVRRASDALAPERPFVPEPAGGRVATIVLFLTVIAWTVGQMWLNADPDDRVIEYLPILIGIPVLVAGWSGCWSVLSKLVRQRFDFWRHVRIVFRYVLASNVVGALLPLMAFSLGWAFPSRIASIAAISVVWAMVLAHLMLILPSRRLVLRVVMGLFLAAGVSLFLVRNYQVHDRVFDQLYVTTLAPPALRLAPTVATRRFIDEARDLKAVLDTHAKDDGARVSTTSPTPSQ